MKIRFKHQNEDKRVLQCTNYYYRCFWHLLISKTHTQFFSVAGFDVKLLKHQLPKYRRSPIVTLRLTIVRSLIYVIMGHPKQLVPVISILRNRVGGNSLVRTLYTFMFKIYKEAKPAILAIFCNFCHFYPNDQVELSRSSKLGHDKCMKLSWHTNGVNYGVSELYLESKALLLARFESRNEKKTAKRTRDCLEFLP